MIDFLAIVIICTLLWINLGYYAVLIHTNFFEGIKNLRTLSPIELIFDWLNLMNTLINWPAIVIRQRHDDDDDDDDDDDGEFENKDSTNVESKEAP